MSEQIIIPKGWTQIEGHCFIDKNNKARFKKKFTYKTDENHRKQLLEYAKTHREANRKRSQEWRKLNSLKKQENNDKNNDEYKKCKDNVLRLRRSINSKQYIANNKRNSDKLKKLGFSARCAEYKHNTCKNVAENCKCVCHKNT